MLKFIDTCRTMWLCCAKHTFRVLSVTHLPTLNTPDQRLPSVNDLRSQLAEAVSAWLTRSPSVETRSGYARDLNQFMAHAGIAVRAWDELPHVRPGHIAAWRDQLLAAGLTNAAISRKLSVVRSLFGYLRAYGYEGPNPADTAFVAAPPVPRDGKTVALTPEDCRRLLDATSAQTPEGVRDRALLAVLAFTGCRVGELCRLRVGDYKTSGGHKVLEIRGKGGKERRVPLHPEAFERLDAWLETAGLQGATGPLFRPVRTARGGGREGFRAAPLSRRAVQVLVARYVRRLQLDPHVTVHSFRVTALTTARERGADIVDLQDFAGHADPRTTLGYIRNRDRLSRSPAYVLKY
ncbi:tyrosine-type recombinase/integrase [Gemmata obscuriglobus]|nr:tyrosine-type recombinase/integrase [Gemmata obscuriglobus]